MSIKIKINLVWRFQDQNISIILYKSDARAIKLLEDLKENAPAERYESPVLPEEEASDEDQSANTLLCAKHGGGCHI